jgi:hypothetical protein
MDLPHDGRHGAARRVAVSANSSAAGPISVICKAHFEIR